MARISTANIPSQVTPITATIDFGPATDPENDTVSTTISAPWIASDTVLSVSLGGPTSDHDLEDAAIENVIISIGNIVPGVSFDIIAHSENFTWGQYQVNVYGV